MTDFSLFENIINEKLIYSSLLVAKTISIDITASFFLTKEVNSEFTKAIIMLMDTRRIKIYRYYHVNWMILDKLML